MPIVDGAAAPDGVSLYDFEDFETSRKLIFDDAKATLMRQFPKEHNGVRMELHDVDYTDPETYSFTEQKHALHDDKFLGRRLKGTVRLIDTTTGKLLDEKKNTTLMKVPWLTDRGTFIREGNEWGSIAQQRLMPGAYSRYQKNGELETQFNVRPGTGHAFRVGFNPNTTQYKFNISGSSLHLYSLLHDIGVSDEELRKSWGDEIFEQNASEYDSRVLDKAYNKIVPEWDRKKNPGRLREDKIQLIKDALNRSQITTSVAKKTLPNLFDRTKAAAWSERGVVMDKIASMKNADLIDVATYINAACGKDIDTSVKRDELIRQIRNVVGTGFAEGSIPDHRVDPEDNAAALVRQMRAKRVYDKIFRKVNGK